MGYHHCQIEPNDWSSGPDDDDICGMDPYAGPGMPIIYNHGREFAHEKCLEKERYAMLSVTGKNVVSSGIGTGFHVPDPPSLSIKSITSNLKEKPIMDIHAIILLHISRYKRAAERMVDYLSDLTNLDPEHAERVSCREEMKQAVADCFAAKQVLAQAERVEKAKGGEQSSVS